MMRSILFTFFLFIIGFTLNAQSCVPNELYRDSAIGAYPPPWKEDRPWGGIPDSACLNTFYEFTLTFKVPPTLTIPPLTVEIDSIVIATTGALQQSEPSVPGGISYVCNPPTCVFTPEDTIACAKIFGTPTEINEFLLKIQTNIYHNFSPFPVPITFPSNDIEGADGEYRLVVLAEGSPECSSTSATEILRSKVSLKNVPNPFSYYTNIEIESRVNEDFMFEVHDLLGQKVHAVKVQLIEGTNQFEFDGSNLSNGMYIFSIGNEEAKISSKMFINR